MLLDFFRIWTLNNFNNVIVGLVLLVIDSTLFAFSSLSDNLCGCFSSAFEGFCDTIQGHPVTKYISDNDSRIYETLLTIYVP